MSYCCWTESEGRAGAALAKDYAGPFTAAISAQEGFRHVSLLRPDDGGDYVLDHCFRKSVAPAEMGRV